jgi:beta-glucosidase
MTFIPVFLLLIVLPMVISASVQPVYLDPGKSIEERVEDLLSRLTLEEKISLCHANSKFTVAGIERLRVPSLSLSDGPHGIREEIKLHSWEPAGWTNDSSTYLPTGTALAATWNPDLAKKFGGVLGEEARARKKDILLGPAINIHRTPLCGRNFEYLSEDPWLIAKMVVPYIQGVQEHDVAACVKHYVLNNQEYDRFTINVEVDERTLREIYLPGFRAAVQKGKVMTVMGAYNKFRGQYLCNNNFLLNEVLKKEWGFEGAVISDWNATHNTVESAQAGLDLEMGTDVRNYNDYFFADPLLRAVKQGKVTEKTVDNKVRRILRVMFKTKMFDHRGKGAFNTSAHQKVAREVAAQAITLLKNENDVLPLDINKINSLAVIGDNATRKHAAGGYSSGIKALYEITPLQGLQEKLEGQVEIRFAQGYEKTSREEYGKPLSVTSNADREAQFIKQAVEVAKKADAVIIFGGLNHDFDTEGKDRPDMKLPYNQDELIEAVTAVNPKTVVVLICGSPVEVHQWIDNVPAILLGWYAGMEGGRVMADVLFGDVNPSGKLPFTFPKRLEDSPAHQLEAYPGKDNTVVYREGLLVGYRYYDTRKVEPQFCFGHGLSYTDFLYSDLQISPADDSKDGAVEISLNLKNEGNYEGAEVVQLYVAKKQSVVERPAKELKGFKKIFLKKNESKSVVFSLKREDLAYYDPDQSHWITETGEYEVFLAGSSRDIRLNGSFELQPE